MSEVVVNPYRYVVPSVQQCTGFNVGYGGDFGGEDPGRQDFGGDDEEREGGDAGDEEEEEEQTKKEAVQVPKLKSEILEMMNISGSLWVR